MKLFVATLLASLTANAACPMPQAPAEFLNLIANTRAISAKAGVAQRTKNMMGLPNLLSACRMTPVTITGVDPLTHKSRPVQVLDFARKGSKPEMMKTVLLMPPTGGQNALDDAYADKLCEGGLRVVLVQHWTDDTLAELDMGMHDRGTMRATAAVEDVIEYINPRSPNQLGILGTSVGAITSALILGIESRISTGVLIVGGVGMSEIISSSTEKTLTRLREERMKAFGFTTLQQYRQALDSQILIEPARFIAAAKPKKVLSFVALKDVTVATKTQELLYEMLGRQELVTRDADHFKTILHTGLNEKRRVAKFFDENLVAPSSSDKPAPAVRDGSKLCLNLE